MSSIAVCIPTYRRPAQLRVTLESLARADGANCVMNVLVVDNDARRTAETVVAAAAPKLNVRYLVEPRRGLANVRNTLVEAALATECQYLLFLDDDEWVDEAWVSELLSTLRRFDADVVCGPVIPVFSPSVPPWIVRGGFFNRPRYVTGARLRMAATNNAIVKRAVIDRLVKHEGGRPLFDGRLNLCSGEDTHFFLRLRHVDAEMRWCDEAIVYERVFESRARFRWLLRRSYRVGSSLTLCYLLGPRRGLSLADRAARSLLRLLAGAALLPVAPLSGRHTMARAIMWCAMGAGGLLGFLGRSYDEYSEIHGY